MQGDSIFFSDALAKEERLILLLPLWLDKTWNNSEVDSLKDFGTDAGNFSNCMHIQTDGRGMWVAPDVGIIKQTLEFPPYVLEFELVEYEVE